MPVFQKWKSHCGPWLPIWSPDFMRPSFPSVYFPALCQNFCHRNSCRVMTPGWQAVPMLCCKLFSLLNFHIFKGSLKAISVPFVSCSSCSASPKLNVMVGLLSDRLHWAQGQSSSNIEWDLQRVSQGDCVAFYPNFNWSLNTMTICHLIYSNITSDPPSSCISLLTVTHWFSLTASALLNFSSSLIYILN